MRRYYDTGLLLKLYTEEWASDAVRAFVTRGKEPLYMSSLHVAECTSALRLKQFCGESEPEQVAQTLAHVTEDARAGVVRRLAVDWDAAWEHCRSLSDAYAPATGCRTLDALHVACALASSTEEFITADARQLALAKLAGLTAINPLERRRSARAPVRA